MQHKRNLEQGKFCLKVLLSDIRLVSSSKCFVFFRFGASQSSEGDSRSSLENGRERDTGSESDEDEEQDEAGTGQCEGSFLLASHSHPVNRSTQS